MKSSSVILGVIVVGTLIIVISKVFKENFVQPRSTRQHIGGQQRLGQWWDIDWPYFNANDWHLNYPQTTGTFEYIPENINTPKTYSLTPRSPKQWDLTYSYDPDTTDGISDADRDLSYAYPDIVKQWYLGY